MATETITLNDTEYTQITDGTNSAYMTVVSWPGFSEVCWADSPSKPAANAPAHDETGKIGFAAPLKVWAKAKRGSAMINVTRWSS